MTSPHGTRIGSVYYEIEPDLSVAKFMAAGNNAGNFISRGLSDGLSEGTRRAMAEVSKIVEDNLGLSKKAAAAARRDIEQLQKDSGAMFGQISKNITSNMTTAASESSGALSRIRGTASSVGESIVRGMDRASSSLRRLSDHIGIAAFQAQMLGGIMTAFITGPVVAATIGLGKFGFETAMNLEDARVGLEALLPPGYDVAGLIQRLQQLAITSPVFAVDDITTFARTLIGAGVEASRVEAILQSLNKAFITFGVTGDRASLVMRAISQVFSKGKVSAEELNQQIGEQLPIWALLDDAAGAARGTMQKMQADGDLTVAMFEDLLVKMGDIPGVAAGATKGVDTLRAQLQQMKESFGARFAEGLIGVFPQIKQQLDILAPALVDLTVALVNNLPTIVDFVIGFLDRLRELKQIWDGLNPVVKEVLKKLALFAPIMGPALILLGSLGTALSMLASVVGALMNPWVLLGVAVVGTLVLLYKKFQEVRDVVQGFVDAVWQGWKEKIWPALQNVWAIVEEKLIPAYKKMLEALNPGSWKEFGSFLGNTLVTIITTVIDVVGFLIDVWATVITILAKVVEGFKAAWKWIGDVGTAIGDFVSGAGSKISEFFSGIWQKITEGVSAAWDRVVSFLRGLITSFRDYVAREMSKPLGRLIIKWFTDVWEFIQNAWNAVKAFLGTIWDVIKSGAKSAWDGISGAISWVWDHIISPVFSAIGAGVGRLGDMFNWLKDHVIDPVWNGIKGVIERTVDTIKDIWDGLVEKLKTPVNLVIRMINKGMIDQWNWAAAYIPFMPTLGHIPELATGGMVRGPGTALSDSILARLSDGEFVVNAQATRQYRGLLEAVNAGHSPSNILAKLMSLDSAFGYSTRAQRSEEYDRLRMAILLDKAGAHWTPPTPTLNTIPSPHVMNDIPASADSGQDVYVTVYVGNELLVHQMQAVVDANNRAIINVARSVRTVV